MYIPDHFKNENMAAVKGFIANNGFGILIHQGKQKLQGTHIPMVLDKNEKGKDLLVGHLSRANPQWKSFKDNDDILAVFMGPHCYISSSWYQKESVPTWNYIAVHVYGKIRIIEGKGLIDDMHMLVDKYEKNSKDPVSVDGLSSKTMEKAKGVVGFQIEITEIQAAYKLSQNRDETDHKNIIKELEHLDDCQSEAVAEEMKEIKPGTDKKY
jgi:transcriptional regulator